MIHRTSCETNRWTSPTSPWYQQQKSKPLLDPPRCDRCILAGKICEVWLCRRCDASWYVMPPLKLPAVSFGGGIPHARSQGVDLKVISRIYSLIWMSKKSPPGDPALLCSCQLSRAGFARELVLVAEVLAAASKQSPPRRTVAKLIQNPGRCTIALMKEPPLKPNSYEGVSARRLGSNGSVAEILSRRHRPVKLKLCPWRR